MYKCYYYDRAVHIPVAVDISTLLDRKNFSYSSNGQVAAHRVTGLIIKRLWYSSSLCTRIRTVAHEIHQLRSQTTVELVESVDVEQVPFVRVRRDRTDLVFVVPVSDDHDQHVNAGRFRLARRPQRRLAIIRRTVGD